MRINFIIAAVAAAASLGFAGAANAQTAGAGVDIGGKATITAKQDKAVTSVAIGQDVDSHIWTGAVLGQVKTKGDLTIDVHQKGAVTSVAIGPRARSSIVTGTISSYSPYK